MMGILFSRNCLTEGGSDRSCHAFQAKVLRAKLLPERQFKLPKLPQKMPKNRSNYEQLTYFLNKTIKMNI
ncbi:MAG: hypothetical protein DRQ49_11330 [Gammaproteobacteria bacterium]|nr:MAG: hypothetical protein DRQ49_11330 [Gammaproteobacteria bacterium]